MGAATSRSITRLRKRGCTPKDMPTLSIALTEHDLVGLDIRSMAGDYLAANYFQSIDRPRAGSLSARSRIGSGPNAS